MIGDDSTTDIWDLETLKTVNFVAGLKSQIPKTRISGNLRKTGNKRWSIMQCGTYKYKHFNKQRDYVLWLETSLGVKRSCLVCCPFLGTSLLSPFLRARCHRKNTMLFLMTVLSKNSSNVRKAFPLTVSGSKKLIGDHNYYRPKKLKTSQYHGGLEQYLEWEKEWSHFAAKSRERGVMLVTAYKSITTIFCDDCWGGNKEKELLDRIYVFRFALIPECCWDTWTRWLNEEASTAIFCEVSGSVRELGIGIVEEASIIWNSTV